MKRKIKMKKVMTLALASMMAFGAVNVVPFSVKADSSSTVTTSDFLFKNATYKVRRQKDFSKWDGTVLIEGINASTVKSGKIFYMWVSDGSEQFKESLATQITDQYDDGSGFSI